MYSKACQLLTKIVLYNILNAPGKLLEKNVKNSWKTLMKVCEPCIQEMLAPASKQDVESLLGAVNYMPKLVPNVANITAPIREQENWISLVTWTSCKVLFLRNQ